MSIIAKSESDNKDEITLAEGIKKVQRSEPPTAQKCAEL